MIKNITCKLVGGPRLPTNQIGSFKMEKLFNELCGLALGDLIRMNGSWKTTQLQKWLEGKIRKTEAKAKVKRIGFDKDPIWKDYKVDEQEFDIVGPEGSRIRLSFWLQPDGTWTIEDVDFYLLNKHLTPTSLHPHC